MTIPILSVGHMRLQRGSAVMLSVMIAALSACTESVRPTDVAPSALTVAWSTTRGYNSLPFRDAPVVTLATTSGAPVVQSGVVVQASLASGSGRIIGNTVAVTRDDGRAVFTDLAVQGIGPFTLRFTAPGLNAAISSPFTQWESPVGLIVAQQPTFVANGAPLSAVQVAPSDVYRDNTREQGLVVTATLASGTGALTGTTTAITDVNGLARFSALSIQGFGPHVLRFSAAGLPPTTSQTINVEQRPTALSVDVQPSGVTSSIAFTRQPRIVLRDVNGARVFQRNVLITASLGSGSGELQGTKSALTDSTGSATFVDLSLVGTGPHSVQFSSTELASARSDIVTLPPFELSFGLDQFALIKAGSFDMGSVAGFGNERPVHRVTITRDFYLQKTEVTQSQWGAVMGRNPSVFVSCGGNCPVENVRPSDIQEFLRRLNAANPGVTFRLPTEAEWEYAARAGGTGDDSTLALAQGWHSGNSGGRTQQVARRAPNGWGLFDMLGNVAEWVSDWYDDYPAVAVRDPVGPPNGTQQVHRGGAWSVPAPLMRIPARQFTEPNESEFAVKSSLGLRLVRTN